MYKTIREYTNAHYPDVATINYPMVALEITADLNSDLILRQAMANILLRSTTDATQSQFRRYILRSSIAIVVEAIQVIEREWWEVAQIDYHQVGMDLSEWMIGRHIGEVEHGFVAGTIMAVNNLPYVQFRTNALTVTASVVKAKMVVSTAVQHTHHSELPVALTSSLAG